LRASTRFVVFAFAFAGSLGPAAAQYFPPQPAPYSAPTYSSAPLPAPGAGANAAPYGQPGPIYRDANSAPPCDPCDDAGLPPAVGGPFEPYPPPSGRVSAGPNDDLAPQPMPNLGSGSLRPPADISDTAPPDVTGSVRAPANAAPTPSVNRSAIAALPPEDQPETGPAKALPPQFRRQVVSYTTIEPSGTIIIDTPHTYLYLVLGNGQAMRYGIGVGREGFTWTGTERISRMKEWPDWFPPREMIERQPYLPRFMAGGDTNPLGARAMYLGSTLYRIHGTNQPSTIGTFVSSGCIRLTNDDVSDLYSRVSVGTRVVVMPGASTPVSSATPTTVTQ
jgi:lipoprotein-anchoring transpeptidase ErfK/SrfK